VFDVISKDPEYCQREMETKYFYVISPDGDRDKKPVKVGVSKNEMTLTRRLQAAKKKLNDTFEFSVVYEMKNGMLAPDDSELNPVKYHSALDIEVKIKAQLSRDFYNVDGYFKGEVFDITPSAVTKLIASIDLSRSPESNIENWHNMNALYKGVSVNIRRDDGKWESLGMHITNDTTLDVRSLADSLSEKFTSGEAIRVIDLQSPTISFTSIPAYSGILRFSLFTQEALPIASLRVACLSYLNDMAVVLSEYEESLWRRYNKQLIVRQMREALEESESVDDEILI
jgi:hypothetical protein